MKVQAIKNCNNNFGSKIMITPGAEHLVDNTSLYACKELAGQIEKLSKNGVNDTVCTLSETIRIPTGEV